MKLVYSDDEDKRLIESGDWKKRLQFDTSIDPRIVRQGETYSLTFQVKDENKANDLIYRLVYNSPDMELSGIQGLCLSPTEAEDIPDIDKSIKLLENTIMYLRRLRSEGI